MKGSYIYFCRRERANGWLPTSTRWRMDLRSQVRTLVDVFHLQLYISAFTAPQLYDHPSLEGKHFGKYVLINKGEYTPGDAPPCISLLRWLTVHLRSKFCTSRSFDDDRRLESSCLLSKPSVSRSYIPEPPCVINEVARAKITPCIH